jgi:lipopolysaccharide/colanic/teichoic acid biosynthesis glycosyltransferase
LRSVSEVTVRPHDPQSVDRLLPPPVRTPAGPRSKRAFDVIVSALLVLLLVPVGALLALAILLESRGPVLYPCPRVGRHGQEFGMLKFRKMRRDASGPPLTSARDDRFTRIGRFLASTRLDELPQLLNVLKGDMSLVGPRPEDRHFVALAESEYETILRVRPGITGLSQLAFARESRILDRPDPMGFYVERLLPAKAYLDILYASRAGIATDLRIIAWTLMAVATRKDLAVHRSTGHVGIRRRPSPTPAAMPSTGGP